MTCTNKIETSQKYLVWLSPHYFHLTFDFFGPLLCLKLIHSAQITVKRLKKQGLWGWNKTQTQSAKSGAQTDICFSFKMLRLKVIYKICLTYLTWWMEWKLKHLDLSQWGLLLDKSFKKECGSEIMKKTSNFSPLFSKVCFWLHQWLFFSIL